MVGLCCIQILEVNNHSKVLIITKEWIAFMHISQQKCLQQMLCVNVLTSGTWLFICKQSLAQNGHNGAK